MCLIQFRWIKITQQKEVTPLKSNETLFGFNNIGGGGGGGWGRNLESKADGRRAGSLLGCWWQVTTDALGWNLEARD